MYIVTGGLGFIGSNLVKKLSDFGEKVCVVDYRDDASKLLNIANCKGVVDVISPHTFRGSLDRFLSYNEVQGVYHQGACTDTTVVNVERMLGENLDFSKEVIIGCLKHGKKIVYASSAAVYGNNWNSEDTINENPLNIYGVSKLLVDNFVRHIIFGTNPETTLVGLRYFNVYGNNENHKGKMASMIHQITEKVKQDKPPVLFKHGEQERDFIHVSDVVNLNLHFMDSDPRQDIFNAGTGQTRTFLQIATYISYVMEKTLGKKHMNPEYVDMPEDVRKFYQFNTKADLRKLRAAGYKKDFMPVTEGIRKTIAPDWKGDFSV